MRLFPKRRAFKLVLSTSDSASCAASFLVDRRHKCFISFFLCCITCFSEILKPQRCHCLSASHKSEKIYLNDRQQSYFLLRVAHLSYSLLKICNDSYTIETKRIYLSLVQHCDPEYSRRGYHGNSYIGQKWEQRKIQTFTVHQFLTIDCFYIRISHDCSCFGVQMFLGDMTWGSTPLWQ